MGKWHIWFKRIDENGKCYAGGVLMEEYVLKSSAARAAKKRFEDDPTAVWIVSQENPWEINTASK